MIRLMTIAALAALVPASAEAACTVEDRLCLMTELEQTAAGIEEQNWRDQTYRELAKSYTYEGQPDKAIALISKIITPDTKAMTIRGIGMAAADSGWTKAQYDALFAKLAAEAVKIEHPPSQGIAYTYIAMSQAFAGDDEGAMATAAAMTNDALRHKAYGESAEIQAERGDFDAAMASIAAIDSLSFRNKAYRTVSKIFVQKNLPGRAYDTALKIDNPYTKAQALQTILNKGVAEEDLSDTSGNE